MSYKDTGYEKLTENNDIHPKLYRTAAVFNATNEGIAKAECLSNKILIPKPSVLETPRHQQLHEPIVNMIVARPVP